MRISFLENKRWNSLANVIPMVRNARGVTSSNRARARAIVGGGGVESYDSWEWGDGGANANARERERTTGRGMNGRSWMRSLHRALELVVVS